MIRKLVVFLFLNFIFLNAALAQTGDPKLKVVTTIFPIYDFVNQIGHDYVDLKKLIPAGMEVHAYSPTPKEIAFIKNADIFMFAGNLMEPWVEDILESVISDGVMVVDLSQGVQLSEVSEDELMEECSVCCKHKYDPHFWIDFDNSKAMVKTIGHILTSRDLKHKEIYSKNVNSYTDALSDLDRQFKATLATAKYRTIIFGGHFAFGYLTNRYDLKHVSPYKGFSPNAQPSPKAIGAVINLLKKSGQKTIFHEELLNPKVARVIAQEVGAQLKLLHGAHNVAKDEWDAGVTFIQIMENNLENLRIGLECQ